MFKSRNGSFAIIALLTIIIGLLCVAIKISRENTDIYEQMQSNPTTADTAMHTESGRRQSGGATIWMMHSDIDTSTPIRSAEDKMNALEKFMQGKDGELVMFDFGGGGCHSTLSEWFTRIHAKLQRVHKAFAWKSRITHIEINNTFHETFPMAMHEYLRQNAKDKLMMICFSDPIKRILAQYDKQWRWGPGCAAHNANNVFMEEYNQSLLTDTNYLELTQHNKHNIDASQRFATIDVNDMLYRVIRFEIERVSGNQDLFQMFINNHYLWTFCCHSQRCSVLRQIESDRKRLAQCMEYSKHVIQAFDVVFVKDWISDLRVQHFVNELFFTHNNVDDQKNKFVAVAQKKHSVSRMGQNYMLDPRYEQLLLLLNKHDMELYEWLRDLVFNRTHIVWQKAKQNKRNRNELLYDLGYQYIIQQQMVN